MGCQPWIDRQGPGDLNENRSVRCAIRSSRVNRDPQINCIEMRNHNYSRSNHRKPAEVRDEAAKLDLMTSGPLFAKALLLGLPSRTLELFDDIRTELVQRFSSRNSLAE